MIELRPYQAESIDAVLDYWQGGGGNPLVDVATGLGKSVVIAKLTRDLCERFPEMRVIMLVHTKELVAQNYQALIRLWREAPAGIYSAGLGRRDTSQRIIFGSIQSLFRQDAYSLGPRHLVIVDECHLIPNGGDGMYRTLLTKLRERVPDLRVCGFTATPFRMDSGRLDGGKERLFDKTVYSYGIAKGIEAGWLSPLVSKAGATEIDVSGVGKRGGEFISGALEAAADIDHITQGAITEMQRYGAERRSWLVFCTGVKHAEHVAEALRKRGVTAKAITGETPAGDRDRAIADFKAGRLRCLTNANVLTTGFDAPSVDLIAMLRPTLSTGLYVQMIGRGTRLAPDKSNCLVLDFAGVIRRHGPVDTVEVRPKKEGGSAAAGVSVDTVRAKTCPTCQSLVALNASVCPDCGHEWPHKERPKHETTADDTPILSKDLKALAPVDLPVERWSHARHTKLGSPDSLRVTYFAGLLSYNQWIAFEHQGFARRKAEQWWRVHGGQFPIPATVADALNRVGELSMPTSILTKNAGKWPEIVGHRFDQEAAA